MKRQITDIVARADESLRGLADPERKRVTEGYFPTSMEILGVSAPKMRTVLREVLRTVKKEAPALVVDLAWALRATGTHEGRQVAFELLEKRTDARGLLRVRDVKGLGQGNDNWASVDCFCCSLSGPLWREGRLTDRQMLLWARSRDRWWRRSALVSTVPLNMKSRGGKGDMERTLMICEVLATDKEPMVAKGLSWALRTLVPVDRKAVMGFMTRWGEDIPSLVRREVRAKLDTGKKNPNR